MASFTARNVIGAPPATRAASRATSASKSASGITRETSPMSRACSPPTSSPSTSMSGARAAGEIGAGGERLGPGAGQHDAARGLTRLQRIERGQHVLHQRRRHRIHRRPVQRERGDAAGVLEEDGVVRHAGNHTIKSPPRETEAAMASAKRENIQPPSLHQRVVSGHLLYSHVVAVEGRRMVFISGQLARDRDGNVVGRHDMRAQLRQVGENLKAALAAAGATLGDLVKTTTFVTDIDEYFKHVDVRMEYFGAALPTSTTVEVRKLAHADFLVEVEAIAMTA